MVYARDLKSLGSKIPCRFESDPRHRVSCPLIREAQMKNAKAIIERGIRVVLEKKQEILMQIPGAVEVHFQKRRETKTGRGELEFFIAVEVAKEWLKEAREDAPKELEGFPMEIWEHIPKRQSKPRKKKKKSWLK
jgi:hypothetical protein